MSLAAAWAALIALSAAATAVALTGGPPLAILALAWVKARLVLGAYLHLDRAPAIRRGFDLVLGLMMLGWAGLWLAA